jgi:hypothetical protein
MLSGTYIRVAVALLVTGGAVTWGLLVLHNLRIAASLHEMGGASDTRLFVATPLAGIVASVVAALLLIKRMNVAALVVSALSLIAALFIALIEQASSAG